MPQSNKGFVAYIGTDLYSRITQASQYTFINFQQHMKEYYSILSHRCLSLIKD